MHLVVVAWTLWVKTKGGIGRVAGCDAGVALHRDGRICVTLACLHGVFLSRGNTKMLKYVHAVFSAGSASHFPVGWQTLFCFRDACKGGALQMVLKLSHDDV